MKTLKTIVLVLTVVYAIGVVVGPLPQSTFHDPVYFRLICFFCAAVSGGLYYGINQKSIIVWKLGWVILAMALVLTINGVVQDRLANDPAKTFPDFWVPIGLMTISGILVAGYWALWWKRQKSYFNSTVSR